jgi:hypothetical protein
MHRLTARLLLLIALLGNFLPLALAASTAPAHQCCFRKGVHHCQGSSGQLGEGLSFNSGSCCNHDCCGAVTTAQWAQAQAEAAGELSQSIEIFLPVRQSFVPAFGAPKDLSARAPPHLPSPTTL